LERNQQYWEMKKKSRRMSEGTRRRRISRKGLLSKKEKEEKVH
jgi:hypothetical protein